ncbi:hypothetical protein EPN96_00635 [bacterium]|nr:MAG: hypothetical protein EPN96_00635 [bacterium]
MAKIDFSSRRRILIAGGGFGGLACMRRLSELLPSSGYDICLLNSSPYHALKFRFHERVALTCPREHVRASLKLLAFASRARFIRDDLLAADFERKFLAGKKGEYPYDILVLALGAGAEFHSIKGVEEHSLNAYSLDGVERCARAVAGLLCYKNGEISRVVVCGGGLTGVEVAAQLRVKAGARRLEITIVEAGERLVPFESFPSERERVIRYLKRARINSVTNDPVAEAGESSLRLASGKKIEADLIIWCGGTRRAPLRGAGEGAFPVNGFLQSEEHPEVFSTGDFASVEEGDRFSNLLSAQRAIYQGKLAAENIARKESGEVLGEASYRPSGEVTALGDFDGVGELKGFVVTGITAAALKRAIGVKYLIELYSGLPLAAVRALAYPFRQT